MQPPRVALVTNVLSHYRVPCFRELAARRDVCVDFFVLTGDMPHRSYVLAAGEAPFPVRILPGRSWHRPPSDDLHLNDPRPALAGHELIILGGWAEPAYLALWSLALANRKRVAFWVESTLFEQPRGGWKDALKRSILRTASVAIVPGSRSADYCAWLGLPRERIFVAPNSVDVSYFRSQAAALLPAREALRAELGFSGAVILFVGRMVERFKSVSILIRAYRQIAAESAGTKLVLIGEGPDRVSYKGLSRELGLNSVEFLNFMPHDELARYYAAADIFVLPSRSEPWGFVLNEAMEFGLPLICSRAAGAAPDLVDEGVNGFTVPSEVEPLAERLACLVTDQGRRRAMGAASKKRIASFTPQAWANGMASGIKAAMDRG